MPSPPPLFDESKKKKKPISSTAGPSAQPSASSSRSHRELELPTRGGPPPAPRAARRERDEIADSRQQQSPPRTTTRKDKQPALSPSPFPVRGAPDVRSARGDEGQIVINKLYTTMQKYKPKLHLEHDSQSEIFIMRGSFRVCSEDDAMLYLRKVNSEPSAYELVYEYTPGRDYRYSLLLTNMKQLDDKTKERLAKNMKPFHASGRGARGNIFTLLTPGPQHAFNFHPSSEANGFNVLYAGKNKEGQDVFRGFDPPDCRDMTQQGFETMMVQKYQKPLTVEDLRMLCKHKRSEKPPDGVITFGETMDILEKVYGRSFHAALKYANKAMPEYYYEASIPEICVPKEYYTDRCKGLVAYVQWI